MKAIIAYSGGLDTSYCVLWLLDQGYEVYTLTVDTGGFTQEELTQIATKAKELGASEHRTVDGKPETYKEFAAYVIKGNILRGGVYPLCVGAERMVQARHAALYAKEIGAQAVCHGSTGAGNDQVRFDVALMALAPEVKIIAPIRELEISRDAELAYLKEKGFDFPAKKKTYSINQGILGTTIGGGETHDPWQSVPDSAYPATVPAAKAPDQKLTLT
ncbi:argininosuccinate synthase, partial [Candidatus Woesearchaeota archaeon CG_4_10_14_0_2_um_filter_57_5]